MYSRPPGGTLDPLHIGDPVIILEMLVCTINESGSIVAAGGHLVWARQSDIGVDARGQLHRLLSCKALASKRTEGLEV